MEARLEEEFRRSSSDKKCSSHWNEAMDAVGVLNS